MRKVRVALAGLVLVGVLVSAPLATSSVSGANGQIVFTSTRDGNREIYLMNSDGTALSNLTNNPATDDWPTTQLPINTGNGPDQYVAFASDRDGDDDLFRVTTTGTFLGPFQAGPGNQTQPAYDSTAGATPRVWVSDHEGNNEIYLRSCCSATPRRLTNDPASDTAPNYRLGGGAIVVFVSDRDGDEEIEKVGVPDEPLPGEDPTPPTVIPLTTNTASDAAPNWSPNGAKIAFETNRDGNYEIYVMNADGSAPVNISNNPASDREPAWSPDGSKIVFQSSRDGNFEIYSMNADGSGQTRLTNSPGGDLNPDWAPYNNRGIVRPKGATPLRASLVPAFSACTAPNGSHGAPLAFPSCTPPLQTSGFLTVGSPDANGAPARSAAVVRLRVDAVPPEDVFIDADAVDIRCLPSTSASVCNQPNAADGPDYSGELQVRLTIQQTDRTDGSPMNDPSTMVEYTLLVDATCMSTPNTIGSSCGAHTTANAVIPGMVQDSKRSIWDLDRVQMYDAGADGDTSTAGGETLFMTQGIFIP